MTSGFNTNDKYLNDILRKSSSKSLLGITTINDLRDMEFNNIEITRRGAHAVARREGHGASLRRVRGRAANPRARRARARLLGGAHAARSERGRRADRACRCRRGRCARARARSRTRRGDALGGGARARDDGGRSRAPRRAPRDAPSRQARHRAFHRERGVRRARSPCTPRAPGPRPRIVRARRAARSRGRCDRRA